MKKEKINKKVVQPSTRLLGLEQLFGSKTRVKLLKLFFNHPEKKYYVRELARMVGTQINGIRRELHNLERLGMVIADDPKARKKYHQLSSSFILYPELKALLLKAQLLLEKNFINNLQKIGKLQYLILTGKFVDQSETATDLFLVGRVHKDRLLHLVRDFEKEFGHEINYTVMTSPEFNYRKNITDRFLYSILEAKKIIVVNELL